VVIKDTRRSLKPIIGLFIRLKIPLSLVYSSRVIASLRLPLRRSKSLIKLKISLIRIVLALLKPK